MTNKTLTMTLAIASILVASSFAMQNAHAQLDVTINYNPNGFMEGPVVDPTATITVVGASPDFAEATLYGPSDMHFATCGPIGPTIDTLGPYEVTCTAVGEFTELGPYCWVVQVGFPDGFLIEFDECTFEPIFAIVDTTPPTITCPADTPAQEGMTDPSYTGFATATDTVDPMPNVDYMDGVVLYGIERLWIAVDYSGNTSSCTQIITVLSDIEIDIKPGSDPNSINPASKGVIPVAVLGSEIFDVSTIDPDTLTFMAAADLATTQNGVYPQWRSYEIVDVNGDGLDDFLAKFPTQTTWIQCYTLEAQVMGTTFDGLSFSGVDSVNPVGKDCKDINGD